MSKWQTSFFLFFQLTGFCQVSPVPSDTVIDGKLLYGYKLNTQYVIHPQYSSAQAFSENIALVKKDGYYKYLDLKGEQIDQQQFVEARMFSEGLAEVKLSDGWGFVNTHLDKVIVGQYEATMPFSEGLAAVKLTRWKFVNKKNELAFPEELDTVMSGFQNGLAIVGLKKEETKLGVISKLGTWIIPCNQKKINRLNDLFFLVQSENDLYSLYDSKGQVHVASMESVQKKNDTLFLFEKEGYKNLFNHKGKVFQKSGFKDYFDGVVVSFPKWKLTDTSFKAIATIEADSFSIVGKYIVRCLNDKKQIIYPKTVGDFYQEIKWLESNAFAVKNEKYWALMDEKGEVLTPFQFEKIEDLNPFVKVMSNGKYGILNKKGKTILDTDYMSIFFRKNTNRFLAHHREYLATYDLDSTRLTKTVEYDSLSELNKNILLGWKGEHALLLDENLNRVDSMFFHDIRLIADTLLLAFEKDSVYRRSIYADSIFVRKMHTRYFLNDTMALVRVSDTLMGVYHFLSDSIHTIDAETAWRHPNMSTRLLTKKKDTIGFANIEGRMLANYPRNFSFIGNEENGFLKVIAKRYFGFIDTNGFLLISTRYDSVQKVKEGLAAVKLRGKWGFVNQKDKLVVQPYYQKVGLFANGKAPAWLAGLATLVDKNGVELFKPKFHSISPSTNGNWMTSKNNVFGFLYPDGQEAFNPKFEKAKETENGFYIVSLYGKEGVLDRKLQIVRSFEEKEIRSLEKMGLFAIKE